MRRVMPVHWGHSQAVKPTATIAFVWTNPRVTTRGYLDATMPRCLHQPAYVQPRLKKSVVKTKSAMIMVTMAWTTVLVVARPTPEAPPVVFRPL